MMRMLFFGILSLLWQAPVFSEVAYPRHEHNGLLTQYIGEPPSVDLTEREQARLQNHKPVFKKVVVADSKRAVTIFPVKASPDVIWSVIRSFENYPEWIEELKAVDVYKHTPGKYYVQFDSESLFTGKHTWFAVHDYPEQGDERNWGSWHLDYDRLSDLDDVVGFWRVETSPLDSTISYVTYSTEVKLKSNAPKFLVNLFANKGLKKTARWVSEQSEKATLLCCQ